jgi:hypothetical protein
MHTLTWTLDEGEWSASCSDHFTPEDGLRRPHYTKCSIEGKHGIQNYNWKIRRETSETNLHKSVMDGFFWLMIGPSDRLL